MKNYLNADSKPLEFNIDFTPKIWKKVAIQMKKAGRKKTKQRPHFRKKELSSDARVIWCLLKKQPQSKEELNKNANISESTFYYILPILEDLGIIKETETGFTLWTYEENEDTLIKTVNEWKKIGLRYPLPSEISAETGISPEKSEELARKTRDKTGWSLPTEAIIENATEKLGEVLCYLARKKKRKLKDFDYKKYPEDPDIKNIAKLELKEHLEMLPKLYIGDDWDNNDLDPDYIASWSLKALKYLGKNYKPRDR